MTPEHSALLLDDIFFWGRHEASSYDGGAGGGGEKVSTRRQVAEVVDMSHTEPSTVWNWLILMDDNARPHTTHAVPECLRRDGIERLDWTRQPDPNTVHRSWNKLQVRISVYEV